MTGKSANIQQALADQITKAMRGGDLANLLSSINVGEGGVTVHITQG